MTTMAARAFSEPQVALTREGYERLRGELGTLTTISRMAMSDRLRDAREQGGDNLELIDALEDQEMLERRITMLEGSLASADVVDDAPCDGTIGIGTRVRLSDINSESTTEYEVVGSLEADAGQRRLSAESPVGRALLGRRSGDVFDVEAPRGRRRFRILAVRPDDRPAERLSARSRRPRAARLRDVDRSALVSAS
jgi:transcription elongation factor GreA